MDCQVQCCVMRYTVTPLETPMGNRYLNEHSSFHHALPSVLPFAIRFCKFSVNLEEAWSTCPWAQRAPTLHLSTSSLLFILFLSNASRPPARPLGSVFLARRWRPRLGHPRVLRSTFSRRRNGTLSYWCQLLLKVDARTAQGGRRKR